VSVSREALVATMTERAYAYLRTLGWAFSATDVKNLTDVLVHATWSGLNEASERLNKLVVGYEADVSGQHYGIASCREVLLEMMKDCS
jgi:hypothetical protein